MAKSRSSSDSEGTRSSSVNERLIDNMIKLQKVHTDLAEKFDKLSREISNLLALFELAARNFSKHPSVKSADDTKGFLEKIDKLLEQNKTIAKGLTLMEEQIRKNMYSPAPEENNSMNIEESLSLEPPSYTSSVKSNRPLPRF